MIYFLHSKMSKNPRALNFCKIFRNPGIPGPQTSLFLHFSLNRYLKETDKWQTITREINAMEQKIGESAKAEY